MKLKPQREDLEFAIYERGYQGAKDFYKLSDKAAEAILYYPILPQVRYNLIDNAYLSEEIADNDLSILSNDYRDDMSVQYSEQRESMKVRIKTGKDKIDANAMDIEDRLHTLFLRKMRQGITFDNRIVNKALIGIKIDNQRKSKANRLYIDTLNTNVQSNNIDDMINDEHLQALLNKYKLTS
ncbi:MAG: hypothetical protein PF444_07840 [Bacteroidales bacterium]|jgi:hypothetical protein|nr:hypothetical protein [Bacteroidales bacterium]